MPLLDINNPAVIKFLVESYEKTDKLRMRWNELNREKLIQTATLQNDEKGYNELDVIKIALEAGMPATTRDNKSGARNRRLKTISDKAIVQGVANMKKGHSVVDVGLGDPEIDPKLARPDTDLSNDPVMRPVELKQKKILYKSIPFFGREVYLKKRNSIAPEDRYYFAETDGWKYGWRLKDSYFSRQKTQHGRVYQLARERNRSGPNPDPKHYKNPGYSGGKCILE